MTKREPFAGVELESEEIGWLVKVAGETICSGDGFWEKLDAEQMAARINAAHEALVEEEVRKAVSEFKMAMTDQMDTLEKSAMNCPSCGLLYPDHGGRCGLYVRREAAEEFRKRAAHKAASMCGVNPSTRRPCFEKENNKLFWCPICTNAGEILVLPTEPEGK